MIKLPANITSRIAAETYDSTEGRLRILLTHALRLPAVSDTMCRTFPHTDPFKEYILLSLIWDSARTYWTSFGKCPSYQMMWDEVQSRHTYRTVKIDMVAVQTILQEIYKAEEKTLNVDYVNGIIEAIRDELGLLEIQRTLVQDPDSAKDAVLRVAKSLEAPPVQRARILRNIFGSGSDDMLKSLKRIPLNVSFLDIALDGGAAIGETIGMVIPSGGGKTTLALQMAEGNVTMKKKMMYVTFEQSIEGDLYCRMNVLASGVSKKLWTTYAASLGTPKPLRYDEFMDAVSLDRFTKAKAMWNEHFIFCDCSDTSKPFHSITQIFEEIERIREQGEEIDLIVVDWWNSMIRRLLVKYPFMSDTRVRAFRANVAEEFKNCCKRHQLRGVVFQQMSGEGTQKSLKALPSSKDSQEDKSFDNYFDYCFAFSKASLKDGEITIKADKVRSVAASVFKVTMNGEYCRIVSSKNPAHGLSIGPVLGNIQV